MNEEIMTFTVTDENGTATECEVLFTFHNDETGKDYIVYTDNTTDEDGDTVVFASVYTPGCDDTELLPIETDAEWDMVEKLLEQLQEEE